jgi:molybdenum cofactor cytidylyltransferase
MGSPKMLLPWGDTTIIEHVISVFAKAGADDILVVTGGAHELVKVEIQECQKNYPVQSVYNQDYMTGDMLSSIQCGLRQITNKNTRVVPSFQMRRGHPWLVARSLWDELLELNQTQTPRDFLNTHAKDIFYVDMDTPSILADLDTPEDYRTSRP